MLLKNKDSLSLKISDDQILKITHFNISWNMFTLTWELTLTGSFHPKKVSGKDQVSVFPCFYIFSKGIIMFIPALVNIHA